MKAEHIFLAISFGIIFITFILALSTALKSKNDAKIVKQYYSDLASDYQLIMHIYNTSITMALFTCVLLLLIFFNPKGKKILNYIFIITMSIVFILSLILIGMCAKLVKTNKGSNKSNPNNYINLGLATGIFGLLSLLFALYILKNKK
jgi:uncharacterized BrkB/YihY/UPF0761 family membrane protein